MLRKLLISTAIVAASTTFTFAADAVVPVDAPVPPVIDDARFDWSGAYVGVQLGWATADHSITEVAPGPGGFTNFQTLGPQGNHDASGIGGGIHAGYRMQNGNFVFGVEGDLGYLDLSDSKGPTASVGNGDDILTLDGGLYATARLTAGFVVGDVLIYGTGGGALLNADIGMQDIGGVTMNAIENETMTGWVAGAGFEVMAGVNWSWKVEYLHMDFGSTRTDSPTSTTTQIFNWDNDLTVDTVMIKLVKKL